MNVLVRVFRWLLSLPAGLVSTLREIVLEKKMEQEQVRPFKERKRRGGGNRSKDILGAKGEIVAEKFLRKKGFKILERNVVMPSCELDLVALNRQTDTLCFIEVKTRRSTRFEQPWQAVDRRRKNHMGAAAREYICQNRLWKKKFQFDIVSIVWPENEEPQIEHLENAFTPTRSRFGS